MSSILLWEIFYATNCLSSISNLEELVARFVLYQPWNLWTVSTCQKRHLYPRSCLDLDLDTDDLRSIWKNPRSLPLFRWRGVNGVYNYYNNQDNHGSGDVGFTTWVWSAECICCLAAPTHGYQLLIRDKNCIIRISEWSGMGCIGRLGFSRTVIWEPKESKHWRLLRMSAAILITRRVELLSGTAIRQHGKVTCGDFRMLHVL